MTKKVLKVLNLGDQKCKITNIELNKAIDMAKLHIWVDKVDIYMI